MTNDKTVPDPSTPREGVSSDLQFHSAEGFLSALSPREDLWAPDPTHWIYRGQANAEWSLKAKAVRSPEEFKKHGIDGDASHWSERKLMLVRLLKRFQRRLDRSGVMIPSEGPRVESIGQASYGANPDLEAFPLMALAQHHGLPTTLLDWTRSGRVAAYFAADAASQPWPRPGTHMAVWALRGGHDREHDFLSPGGLGFYQAPAFTNPNLRAQSALFTLVNTEDDASIEQVVARWRSSIPAPKLLRLTLQRSEAPKLLRLLSYEGVDGASMFPGADGVARALREIALWDDLAERRGE